MADLDLTNVCMCIISLIIYSVLAFGGMGRSDDDESLEESVDASWHSESSSSDESETEGEEHVTECEDIEVITRKGEDVLLNIHDQLDLAKLQQVVLKKKNTTSSYR